MFGAFGLAFTGDSLGFNQLTIKLSYPNTVVNMLSFIRLAETEGGEQKLRCFWHQHYYLLAVVICAQGLRSEVLSVT